MAYSPEAGLLNSLEVVRNQTIRVRLEPVPRIDLLKLFSMVFF